MPGARSTRRSLLTGLAFLAPNILGFLLFTLIPLGFSLVLAFSNWDLKKHNMFHPQQRIRMIGLENVQRLIASDDFWKFFGNTLFFLIGLPIGIAASLGTALLLSKDFGRGGGRVRAVLIAGGVLITSSLLLIAAGESATAMSLLMISVVGGIFILGTAAGTTAFRTLLYLPNFTSGVATFLLWKKLYNPQTGPITLALDPVLGALGNAVNNAPGWMVGGGGFWVCIGMALLTLAFGLRKMSRDARDGELGVVAAILPICFLVLPVVVFVGMIGAGISLLAVLAVWWAATRRAEDGLIPSKKLEGFGNAFMLSVLLMAAEFALLGWALVMRQLPAMAQAGLHSPAWLNRYEWAKPAMMLMGLWGGIGGNTMLLYLAALMSVPGELYEAADIDGASRFAKFWNVSWPQLAPTTFFVIVMGVIGGLQGGFETARVMTKGGPAGSTTTLSYFIYTEGFETGRLGFSSAVAWTMFVMVLMLTLFNWKVGSKYVND